MEKLKSRRKREKKRGYYLREIEECAWKQVAHELKGSMFQILSNAMI